LEQAEIADLVGISVSTVRRRLDRLTKRVNLLMNGDPVLAPYIGPARVSVAPSGGGAGGAGAARRLQSETPTK
jgi:hypothetical protein